MIFVIAEPLIRPTTRENLIDGLLNKRDIDIDSCLFIGYTDDFEKTLSDFRDAFPRVDVLYTYEDGTKEDEKKLLAYFESYLWPWGRNLPWFFFKAEITNFFDSCPTIEDIRKRLSHIIVS